MRYYFDSKEKLIAAFTTMSFNDALIIFNQYISNNFGYYIMHIEKFLLSKFGLTYKTYADWLFKNQKPSLVLQSKIINQIIEVVNNTFSSEKAFTVCVSIVEKKI